MTPPTPPLAKRPPLLLRGALWRLALATAISGVLLLLWRWAVA